MASSVRSPRGLAGFSALGASPSADVSSFVPSWGPLGKDTVPRPHILLTESSTLFSCRLLAGAALNSCRPPAFFTRWAPLPQSGNGNLPHVQPLAPGISLSGRAQAFSGLTGFGQTLVDNLLFD